MGVALQRTMNLAGYLDWEERQELRYEFDGFQPVAMTGGTLRHESIGYRLSTLLFMRLEGQTLSSVGTDDQDRGAGPYPLSGRVRELYSGSSERHYCSRTSRR